MRRSAAQNRDTALHHSLIPRTVEQRERPMQKERNIAEIDPPAFARILTEKLERVIEEQAKVEKINKLFQEVSGAFFFFSPGAPLGQICVHTRVCL